MGKNRKHSEGRKLKEEGRSDVNEMGIDSRLEHEARIKMAEDDLRTYYVDRSLAERAAARQALEDREEEEATAAAAAAATHKAIAADAQEAIAAPAVPVEEDLAAPAAPALADPIEEAAPAAN